jgi:CubicO group peptidase (beta-lactamase class C family)
MPSNPPSRREVLKGVVALTAAASTGFVEDRGAGAIERRRFLPRRRDPLGLGYMLNMQPGPNGRSAGTVSWGGIFNTYYWIDPSKRVTGLIMTQILPFADPRALKLYGQFERAVYETLKAV